METSVVEEYLEAIYKLGSEGRAAGPTELGKALSVSPPSAMEMMNRLTEKGLATRVGRKGVTLTRRGEREALRLIRKHRLSERFLVDVLGVDWKDAHEEACKFEHVLSADVESRMEALLKNPATCPHGNPIPDREGRTREESLVALSGLREGQAAVIVRISDEKRDFLEYLATIGMTPGRALRVEQVAPFDGPFMVRVGDARYAIGRDVAARIWVKAR